VRKRTLNPETLSWGWVGFGFIPSKKISKQDCLDSGALVVLGHSSGGKVP